MPLELDSPYQISKIVGEFYSVYYHRQHGLPTVRARFQNVYGPGEILGAGHWRGTPATVWRNVIPTFVYRALQGTAAGARQRRRGKPRTSSTSGDIVAWPRSLRERGAPGDVYNLASGDETTILELASSSNELTGNPTPPVVRPPRDWDRSGKRFGSTEKARRELGFAAGGAASRTGWGRRSSGRASTSS